MMRKKILFIHRWLAIPFGVFCFIICITGAIMVFQSELLETLNYSSYHLDIPSDGNRLSDRELAEKVLVQIDDSQIITFIRVPAEAGRPAEVNIAGMGQKNLLVNPYTGEVLGYPRYQEFFDGVKSLHRWLFNKPDNHQQGTLSVGRVVMGLTAIVMAIILLTGICLWWPKSKKMLKNRLKVNTSKGFRRFVYDSHVSLGIYAVVFLLLMSLTGPTWSFGWYKKAAQTTMGMQEEIRVDQMLHRGNMHHSDMRKNDGDIAKPIKQTAESVNIMHDGGNGQDKQQGANFHMLMSSLHMGRWAGWLSKLIYLFAALIGATLPLSGYYMWWKRTHASVK